MGDISICRTCGEHIDVPFLAQTVSDCLLPEYNIPIPSSEYEKYLRTIFHGFCIECIVPLNCIECLNDTDILLDKICNVCCRDTSNIEMYEPNNFQQIIAKWK